MESHSFLTWSVMGLLKSLHQKNLLPKDDPVITQLQKSFSKACSSLASSMTSSAAFVTMKRRQLLLSHVVPSVSEAQKRNLLSDPFFQTVSLFDASSVESARSAARDLSLLSRILRPRPRLLNLDDRDLLAPQAVEAPLDSILGLRLRSVPLPLSDSSLGKRVMRLSGEQQRRVRSRSRGRRSRSSGDRTDRRAKKRSRRRSPSPERSSRRREKRYRSSSDSSEDERADASPPRDRRAHGGARAGGSTWDYDRPRSYARVNPDQSGARRRSPGPSGVADDDRSSTFESVDFARDDSFRAVLGLIREFHDMAEPATVPGARCKTSLASAYGLAADSSPAFTLPLSPLLSTLLLDINSDLCKFMEDQTVHGFLPVPGRRQRRYYGTSTSSFPGPYSVPPGMTSITMEKASEVRKRSVSLSASQVSSMETMLSGMCEVASWLDWWLSTCGGYRDLLPVEARADFERLMMSGSRALEFLASQGCTALGNLVLSRRDALLADVRSTVPAEEVARLRYSPLPQSAAIFPHALLDSALLKMRAAASDALVQRTLHLPRIPRKPAASGQASGSTTARSGQASTSGAAQTPKQSASSSSSGQSGQGKKKGRGKAPFSSSSRGSGRSGGKGKGAGKKSA